MLNSYRPYNSIKMTVSIDKIPPIKFCLYNENSEDIDL